MFSDFGLITKVLTPPSPCPSTVPMCTHALSICTLSVYALTMSTFSPVLWVSTTDRILVTPQPTPSVPDSLLYFSAC